MYYGEMARTSTQNPCTNRLVHCVLCFPIVWLYSMAHHFGENHASFTSPIALSITANEKGMVVKWSAKKKNKKYSHHEMDEEDARDAAEGPPSTTASPPHPPKTNHSSISSSLSSSSSFSKASYGAECSRPLWSVGNRNQE